MLRSLAIFALVLLIVVLAVPLGLGVAMTGGCPECDGPGAHCGVALCLAVLASLLIVVLGSRGVASPTSTSSSLLLLAYAQERPPQTPTFG